jgi:hypothetical protein
MDQTFTIEFERIGRKRDLAALPVKVPERQWGRTADYLAEKIHTYARPHLMSRGFEVVVDLAKGSGYLFTGQPAGNFTIIEEGE